MCCGVVTAVKNMKRTLARRFLCVRNADASYITERAPCAVTASGVYEGSMLCAVRARYKKGVHDDFKMETKTQKAEKTLEPPRRLYVSPEL